MSGKSTKAARRGEEASVTRARRSVASARRAGSGRSWPIYAVVAVLVTAVIAGVVMVTRQSSGAVGTDPAGTASAAPITAITGVTDFRTSAASTLTRNHKQGVVAYQQSPPVGGDHNPVWQTCTGAVYDAPIANEHAVHSLEHGAVWITYRPSLAADQVQALAAKVKGVDYMLMSPYQGLDQPISVQAWGYQLKTDSASDPRIDQFIAAARIKPAPEPGATCSGGVTATGTAPQNVSAGM